MNVWLKVGVIALIIMVCAVLYLVFKPEKTQGPEEAVEAPQSQQQDSTSSAIRGMKAP